MWETIEGKGLRELWQTFMTGNYYYCLECQAQCPASALYPSEERPEGMAGPEAAG